MIPILRKKPEVAKAHTEPATFQLQFDNVRQITQGVTQRPDGSVFHGTTYDITEQCTINGTLHSDAQFHDITSAACFLGQLRNAGARSMQDSARTNLINLADRLLNPQHFQTSHGGFKDGE